MFLFPWLDLGIDIPDFEKSIFWVMSDFGPFQPPENVIFDIGDYFQGPIGRAQGKNFEKNFFGNFQKDSKLSKNIYIGYSPTT